MELVELNPTVAVRGPHHCDVASNVLESNEKVHVTTLDWCLAFQLHAKLGKERLGSVKVINHD